MRHEPRTLLSVVLVLLAGIAVACGGGSGGARAPRSNPSVPVVPAVPRLRIAAVGDTHGYNVPPDDPLGPAADLLRGADLFLFNHEGAIRTTGITCVAAPDQSAIVSGPEIAAFLSPALRNVATLANNHIHDCGVVGIAETTAALGAHGIEVTGSADREPLRLRLNDLDVAVLSRLAGLTIPGAAAWDPASDPGLISDLAITSDLVIVALHMHIGSSWTADAPPAHVALVDAALDAGADLVVGHGSHVPQGVRVRSGGIGLLSLGNFLFRPDYTMPGKAHRSIVAEVAVHEDRMELVLHPYRLDAGGRPRLPTASDARQMLEKLAEFSDQLQTSLEIRGGVGRLEIPGPAR